MTDAQAVGARAGPQTNRRVIVWFRRDLRLADNPALVAALRMAPEVIPVYLWAPEEEGQFQPGRCSRWWLHHSLQALDADLRALGSRLLCFRAADSCAVLTQLAQLLGAQAVLFNHLYDPISMVRDNEVKAGLSSCGIFCQSFNADILREPWEVLDLGGKPFTCFDAFWTAHCSLPFPPPPPLPTPAALPPLPAGIEVEAGAVPLAELAMLTPEEEMSNAQLEFHWTPGSAGAHRVLGEFLRGGRLHAFDRDRAKTDRASTSRLSPHIHYGEVSVRHIYCVARQQELEWARLGEGGTSVQDFLRQLGYREYSRYLSFHFPFTHERSLLEHLRAVPWRFDQRLFKAWRQGRTGYPLVDAAMREVWGTGWMHNRMRVVAASFMVKNLLLPWQWGLKHYWDALLDADLECDALGWQYVAGCMADAHAFSYTIDHGAEAKRFDPDGNYVRRWLPVLARLPAKYIHEPWLAPEHVLADAGVELGCNYPYPVIGVEESLAALAAADAVVQQCLKGGGGGGACAAAGPFRPATDADPAEAERLFEENYRQEVLYGVTPAAAPADRTEGCGTSEDVQSNVVGPPDNEAAASCQLEPPGSTAGGFSGRAAAAAASQGRPSPATRSTMAAAVSAAPPTHTAKRLAAAVTGAAAAAVGGTPASDGTLQEEEQPRAMEVPGWLPLPATLSPSMPGGSGTGTGHASLTALLGVVPSLSEDAGVLVPQLGRNQSWEPTVSNLMLQQHDSSPAAAPSTLARAGQQGSISPGCSSPPGPAAGNPARAAGAVVSADADERWPPPQPQQQRSPAAARDKEQPASPQQRQDDEGQGPASCKRQRAGSPPTSRT